jgi:hypothetical protein
VSAVVVPADAPKTVDLALDTDLPAPASRVDVVIQLPPNFKQNPIIVPNLAIKGNKVSIPLDLIVAAVANAKDQFPQVTVDQGKKALASVILGPTVLSFKNIYGHPLGMERTTSNALEIKWTEDKTPAATSPAPSSGAAAPTADDRVAQGPPLDAAARLSMPPSCRSQRWSRRQVAPCRPPRFQRRPRRPRRRPGRSRPPAWSCRGRGRRSVRTRGRCATAWCLAEKRFPRGSGFPS